MPRKRNKKYHSSPFPRVRALNADARARTGRGKPIVGITRKRVVGGKWSNRHARGWHAVRRDLRGRY